MVICYFYCYLVAEEEPTAFLLWGKYRHIYSLARQCFKKKMCAIQGDPRWVLVNMQNGSTLQTCCISSWLLQSLGQDCSSCLVHKPLFPSFPLASSVFRNFWMILISQWCTRLSKVCGEPLWLQTLTIGEICGGSNTFSFANTYLFCWGIKASGGGSVKKRNKDKNEGVTTWKIEAEF